MAYEGGRLAPWFSSKPNDRFCRRLARKGGARQTQLTKLKTPVDSGALRDSIEQKVLVITVDEHGDRVYEDGCETDSAYGAAREHGSGLWGPHHAKYEIRPKNPEGWLHWVDPHTGQDVYAKRVMHPGSQGAHMFAIAAAMTEKEIDGLARDLLLRWKAEVERQNHSGLRGRPG